MRRLILSLLFFPAIPLLGAEEGEQRFLEPFKFELGLNARGSSTHVQGTDVDLRSIGADLSLGFFLTSWFEPGIKVEYLHTKTEFDDDETETHDLVGGPQLIFNLPTNTRLVPFAFGSGGPTYQFVEENNQRTFEELGAFWEAGGGLRIFATDNVAVNFRVSFQQFLFNDSPDFNVIVGAAGISLFF